MVEITFKPADANQTGPLLEMRREFCAHERLSFDERADLSVLHKIMADPSLGRVYMMLAGEEVAGYVVLTFGFSLEYGGRDALIDEIYVRESYRGRGIGTRCLQFIESVCRDLGVRALHLEVDRANANAQGVYRKSGFVDHDRYLMTRWID